MKAKSKIIEIDDIGRILFERSNRAKNINISVKPFRGVRVAVPYRVSFDKAIHFAQSKKNWIRNHLNKMKIIKGDLIKLTDQHEPKQWMDIMICENSHF